MITFLMVADCFVYTSLWVAEFVRQRCEMVAAWIYRCAPLWTWLYLTSVVDKYMVEEIRALLCATVVDVLRMRTAMICFLRRF